MSDEIKEILEYYRKYMSIKDCIKLSKIEDYITYLQEENEYLKKHQRFHKKFGNDYIFCVEGDKETYKDLLLEKQEELEEYKSRIDKAVDYMNGVFQRNEDGTDNIWVLDFYEILNILNGDKND